MRAFWAYGFIDWADQSLPTGMGRLTKKRGSDRQSIFLSGWPMNVSQRASLDWRDKKVEPQRASCLRGREQIQPTVGSDRGPAQFAARERVTADGTSTASTSYLLPPPRPAVRPSQLSRAPIGQRRSIRGSIAADFCLKRAD